MNASVAAAHKELKQRAQNMMDAHNQFSQVIESRAFPHPFLPRILGYDPVQRGTQTFVVLEWPRVEALCAAVDALLRHMRTSIVLQDKRVRRFFRAAHQTRVLTDLRQVAAFAQQVGPDMVQSLRQQSGDVVYINLVARPSAHAAIRPDFSIIGIAVDARVVDDSDSVDVLSRLFEAAISDKGALAQLTKYMIPPPELVEASPDQKKQRVQQHLDSVKKLPCANCGQKAPHVCSCCQTMRYCSAQCQKQHWSTSHRAVCQTMAKASATYRAMAYDPRC